MPAPESPFPGVSPTMFREDLGIYSWVCAPGAMVNRFAPGTHATADAARFVTVEVDRAMQEAFPGAKYIYVHDFSGVATYDSEIRKVYIEWGKERTTQGVVDAVWLVPPTMNPLVKMGVTAGLVALRAFGQNIHMARELRTLVATLELTPVAGEPG